MNRLTSRESSFALAPLAWLALVAVLGAAIVVVWFFRDGDASSSGENDGPRLMSVEELRQPVHWHADFAVFVRGERFDFNRPEFVSKEGEEKNPWVHIHEPRYTVVHSHREQTTWDEFLTSIGFKLTDTSLMLPSGETLENTDSEQLKFYVNGVRIDSLMFQDILDLNQVLISYGPETDDEVLATQWPEVTDEACIPSGLCRDRGIPEDEPCGKGSGTCTG
jgi:hypothetical protein